MDSDNDNIIIIARYVENVSWVLKLLQNTWINKVLIVNKGPPLDLKHDKIQIVNAHNVGREGETYLSYIINNYNNLPKHIFFCQGKPFVHSVSFLNYFTKNNFDTYKNKNYNGMTESFKPNIPINYNINNTFHENDMKKVEYLIDVQSLQVVGHNMFKDIGVNFFNSDYHNKLWKKIDIKSKYIRFYYSACFYTIADAIKNRDLQFYIDLRNFLFTEDVDGGLHGYVLERYWCYILDPISFNSLNEYYNNLIDSNFIGLFDKNHNVLVIIKNNRNNKILVKNNCFLLHEREKVLPSLSVDVGRSGKVLGKYYCNSLNVAKQTYLRFINNKKR